MLYSHTRTYYHSTTYVGGFVSRVEVFDLTSDQVLADSAVGSDTADTVPSPPSSPLEQLAAAFESLSLH